MRNTFFSRAFALAAVATVLLGAPVTASGVAVDYFYLDSCTHAAFLDMAIHPPAITRDGVTYVAIQGKDLEPYASAYRHTSKAWSGPVKAGDNPLVGDTHGAPALAIDELGYLHIFYGGHSTPMKHARSANPLDITAWQQLANVAPSATYPQVVDHPDGSIELFYREGGTTPRWVSKRSYDNGATWGSAAPVLAGDSAAGYYANFVAGPSGEVYATAVGLSWSDWFAGNDWARSDVYFFRRGVDGTWRNVGGDALATPVSLADARSKCLVYDSAGANTNQVVVRSDIDGRPVILYLTGSGAGPSSYSWRLARWTGGAWETTVIAPTDSFYDGATLDVRADGSLDAYVTVGGTQGLGSGDRDYTDLGGFIHRFHAAEASASFVDGGRIDPGGTGLLYNSPQLVESGHPDARVLFSEFDRPYLYASPTYVWGDGGLLGRSMTARVNRVYGDNRILTSVAVSKQAYPMAPVTVVLARADRFQDALAGAPLAYAVQGPILLTYPNALPAAVSTEIRRLKPARVIVLGGRSAVSDAVVNSVKAIPGVTGVERVAGSDRFSTAAAIARRLQSASKRWTGAAFVVSGTSYADALAAGPLASVRGVPILLSLRDTLPPATASAIGELGISSTTVIGGAGAIGAGPLAALPAPTRVAGATRYATAAEVARLGLASDLLPRHVVVASGADFPDGLVGGVYAARLHAPVLLTAPSAVPSATVAVLKENAGRTVDVRMLGGPAVVWSSAITGIRRALGL